ncbi:MAG: hypothetical protein U0002_12910 [Thermoanaerobaculia bacterium]
MLVTAADIVDLLVSTAKAREYVLGSELGQAIRARFPELDFKRQFGALSSFIQRHCEGEIVRLGSQSGADDIYTHTSRAGTVNLGNTSAARGQSAVTLWQAFSNPSRRERVVVDHTTGQIVVLQPDAEAQSSEVVPQLTDADHRQIARAFLPELEERSRQDFEAALQEPSYWQTWLRLMQRGSAAQHERWKEFRKERILDSFRQRLSRLGVGESMIEAATSALLRSIRSTPYAGSRSVQPSASTAALHALVHSAIDRMSEKELRLLWLPLGGVLDALNGRR